eukprot:UN33390
MYQFSLDAYVDLFSRSIIESRKTAEEDDDLDERLTKLNNYHTRSVYSNTCRGLFEKHKLLFSFLMCVRKAQTENNIDEEEYAFFLRGGQVVNRDELPENDNSDWCDEIAWDNITQLAKLEVFKDLLDSFLQNGGNWKAWFQEEKPEKARLPGDWDNTLNQFQKMCILRSLRPDRVVFGIRDYICTNLGAFYVQPPPFNAQEIYSDSTPYTPIIFVLSAGSDPSATLSELAKQQKKEVLWLSLGAGQDEPAKVKLRKGLQEGCWVFFANCHLSISWMPELE